MSTVAGRRRQSSMFAVMNQVVDVLDSTSLEMFEMLNRIRGIFSLFGCGHVREDKASSVFLSLEDFVFSGGKARERFIDISNQLGKLKTHQAFG